MTPKQALQIMAVLTAAYPQVDVSEETIEIYTKFLLDLPYEVGQVGALRIIGENKWFPSIAELRQRLIESIPQNQLPSSGEAWGEVMAQIRLVGYHGTPTFSQPAITKTVQAMGWKELCASDNQMADRAHFFRIYESYRDREIQERTMIPEIRALQAKVTKELEKSINTEGEDWFKEVKK